jgi:hypothetical protein
MNGFFNVKGWQADMTTEYIPVVFDPATNDHRPLADGETIVTYVPAEALNPAPMLAYISGAGDATKLTQETVVVGRTDKELNYRIDFKWTSGTLSGTTTLQLQDVQVNRVFSFSPGMLSLANDAAVDQLGFTRDLFIKFKTGSSGLYEGTLFFNYYTVDMTL